MGRDKELGEVVSAIISLVNNQYSFLVELLCVLSNVKWSDPGHFLKSQGNFFCHFHVPFFYIFLTPKNYR